MITDLGAAWWQEKVNWELSHNQKSTSMLLPVKRQELEAKYRLDEPYEGYPPDLPDEWEKPPSPYHFDPVTGPPFKPRRPLPPNTVQFQATEHLKIGTAVRQGAGGIRAARPGEMVIGYAISEAQSGDYVLVQMT